MIRRSTSWPRVTPRAWTLRIGLPAVYVRLVHQDVAVEPSGPQQGRVQDLGTVGGGQDDDPLVGVEPVHLGQELVEGLLPLVVAAHHVGPPGPAQGIDLVDEDDTGGVLGGLGEKVPDPGGAHAHEHLHKARAGNGVEGHLGLAGHGLGQEGLARARGPDHEHALGDAPAQAGIAVRVLEKLHHLLEFLLGLLGPGHVLEGHLGVAFGVDPGLGLAKGHHPGPAAAHALHDQRPDRDHQADGQDPAEDEGVQKGVLDLALEVDVLVLEQLDQVRVRNPVDQVDPGPASGTGLGPGAFFLGGQPLVADGHALDLPRLHLVQEVGVGDLIHLGRAHERLHRADQQQGPQDVPKRKPDFIVHP